MSVANVVADLAIAQVKLATKDAEIATLREALVWIELVALKGGLVPELVFDSIKRRATTALAAHAALEMSGGVK